MQTRDKHSPLITHNQTRRSRRKLPKTEPTLAPTGAFRYPLWRCEQLVATSAQVGRQAPRVLLHQKHIPMGHAQLRKRPNAPVQVQFREVGGSVGALLKPHLYLRGSALPGQAGSLPQVLQQRSGTDSCTIALPAHTGRKDVTVTVV